MGREYFTGLGVIFVLSQASLTVPGAHLRTRGAMGKMMEEQEACSSTLMPNTETVIHENK